MIKLGLQLEDDKIEEEVPGLSVNKSFNSFFFNFY